MDAESFSFSSQLGIDKILDESPTFTTSVPATAIPITGVRRITYSHEYGSSTVPNLMFSLNGSSFYPMGVQVVTGDGYVTAYAKADSSNIYVTFVNLSTSSVNVWLYYNVEGI